MYKIEMASLKHLRVTVCVYLNYLIGFIVILDILFCDCHLYYFELVLFIGCIK